MGVCVYVVYQSKVIKMRLLSIKTAANGLTAIQPLSTTDTNLYSMTERKGGDGEMQRHRIYLNNVYQASNCRAILATCLKFTHLKSLLLLTFAENTQTNA